MDTDPDPVFVRRSVAYYSISDDDAEDYDRLKMVLLARVGALQRISLL